VRDQLHTPAVLPLGKEAPGTHRMKSSLGHRVGLEILGKLNIKMMGKLAQYCASEILSQIGPSALYTGAGVINWRAWHIYM